MAGGPHAASARGAFLTRVNARADGVARPHPPIDVDGVRATPSPRDARRPPLRRERRSTRRADHVADTNNQSATPSPRHHPTQARPPPPSSSRPLPEHPRTTTTLATRPTAPTVARSRPRAPGGWRLVCYLPLGRTGTRIRCRCGMEHRSSAKGPSPRRLLWTLRRRRLLP